MSKAKADANPDALPQPDLFGEGSGIASPLNVPRKRAAAKAGTAPIKTAPKISGLMNVRQAAERLGLCKSTLDKMRCTGKGPRFIRSTDRAIRYDPTDLDAWIAERRRLRTKDA